MQRVMLRPPLLAPPPSVGLSYACAQGQAPVIIEVVPASPAMSAGLIEGDRILSVSSSNMQERTEVTGFGGDQLTQLLEQTWKASALAGGKMILQMQRSHRVFFADLFAKRVPDDDPFAELERLLEQVKHSGDLAEMRSLTHKFNAKLAELKIQEETSKQHLQLEIEIEKCKQQHLQVEIRKTRASSQYPAHGYGGGPPLVYGPLPGYRGGQAYRPQYGQMQQYGGPPGYGYGRGFTQNSHLLGPGWEDYDPRKHNWKHLGPEDQFC